MRPATPSRSAPPMEPNPMTDLLPVVMTPRATEISEACSDSCCSSAPPIATRSEAWLRAARHARWLAWASLVWMTTEGVVGLYAGLTAASIALVAWALGSVVEGLASVIVVWRFTGSRTLSETAERSAQRAVAISFWLLAPYVAIESIRNLVTGHHPATSLVGIILTASSVVLMPLLGHAKQRLALTLNSRATA